MSTSSRRSLLPNRQLNSVKNNADVDRRRSRASSRAHRFEVSYEDAFSFALRVAYLHYLLQPKQKRRKFVPAPKRHSTIGLADMMNELKGRDSKSFKLPHSFRKDLEKRMMGVISGSERLQGYNDPGIKRSFANAYNSFTEESFKRSIDKDRKLEQYILVFYSRATTVCQSVASEGDSYKFTVDRHVAMFVRLVINVLRDHGHERDRADLLQSLQSLEGRLLSNDQALYIASGATSEGTYVEEDVPLSYEIKDMHMVQVVAKIFGQANSDVQAILNEHRSIWTEEAAMKDLKSYQHRLSTGLPGTLSPRDFDVDEAFQEWKKAEVPSLTQMMLDLLKAKPELAKTNTDGDKPLPLRPTSMYGTEQAYADLGRAVQGADSGDPYGFDASLSMGSLSLDESSSIRVVDDSAYTFVPTHPREFYKEILRYTLTYDLLHGDRSNEIPVSKDSLEFLTELAVRWRVPQFSRLVAFLEVAATKFLDTELGSVEELDQCFDFAKNPQPESKKQPHLHLHSSGLLEIDPSRWTTHDYAAYSKTLMALHSALQRELYQVLITCYQQSKPKSIGPVMHVLTNHIRADPAFSQRQEDAAFYTEQLQEGLRQAASEAYTKNLEKVVPENQDDWNFGHVVQLGQDVASLCEKLKKRYKKNPEIFGANPYKILVETTFPSFENDAFELIKRIFQSAEDRGEDIDIQEAFLLYGELVQIHDIHTELLSKQPFAFDIEELLIKFVWRFIGAAEMKMEEYVDQALKEDQFQVRTRPDADPTDSERHSVSVLDMFRAFHQTKDSILKLDWRNEYHVAKFRTALARIFAAGIGRYCEAVEDMFAKEMDRPRAQDLAATQQTTQERFMRIAQNAWNSREKAEVFQFYPESFVKLNNIEYAMQELDKLENVLGVDECARVIERVEGPQQRNTRAPNKYVFTIKIVEAEDLKACDPSGFSDPYVVLCDEFQKRLYKTRVISQNLNPRWDESVDITVTQPLNVIATIWDWDTFGDHDFVGRTSLKLDPRHFSDYLPREFWLDLDTQGRVLLRVSMEGERDDIQFHFGKAFRFLKRAERDMVRKITEKLNTEINMVISHNTLKSLLSRGIGASITSLWNKRASNVPAPTAEEMNQCLQPLLEYFDANFAVMKQTLTEATMNAVMARLWKEVLIAIENLLVPPLSDKPSSQKPLSQRETDVVHHWKEHLFQFFNAKDAATGEIFGISEAVLKSPKWHDLNTLYFFYHEPTAQLIRESERMAAAAIARQKEALNGTPGSRHTAPATLMVPPATGGGGQGLLPAAMGGSFASMGTIRRGKSIVMSRNLGTMRRAKEEKRKEAQAEPSDDMILRILRMRPDAGNYLRDRARQKERTQAAAQAAMIVRNSVMGGGGFGAGPAFGGGPSGAYGRGGVPRR